MAPPKTLRWGILGAGAIAGTFTRGLAASTLGKPVAVGSRSAVKAARFASEHGGLRAHASYEALAADDEVDAVYVATTHPQHLAASQICLRAGKAVLCEKPLTVNAAEAAELIATARETKRFLMEAMWTRFLPAMAQCRRWLAAGAIGEPRMLNADFGFRGGADPRSRTLDPAAAGGGLLDVGVYTVAFSTMVFGAQPEAVSAVGHLGASGVDEQCAMLMRWQGGALAVLSSAVRTSTPMAAWIAGTEGRIELPSFWNGRIAILHRDGQPPERLEPAFAGNGYHYQAEEVARALANGETESRLMPLAESLAIQRIMDQARAQMGLRYPMERATPAQAATKG